MKLAILSLYFHPDAGANAVIITQLAQRLVARGHHVSAICGMPHYNDNRIWPSYRGRLSRRERLGKIEVHHTWLYLPAHKASICGRLLSYISFNILSVLAGLLGARPDVILAPSPPLTIGLAAWFIGLLRRAPYIYNVQDIYPDIAVRLGALKNRHLIRLFGWMESFVYRRAAAISVISEGFRQTLIRKGVPPRKIAVIPNFVDIDYITPRPKENPFARREGLLDRFVVLFAGNAGLSQGLEHVLQAAKALSGHPEILFLMVGNGVAKPALQAQAAEMGLSNVRFLPFQPWEQVPDLYASADLCLIPLRVGIAQESVPSKALTIMAAGKPIVASVDRGSDICTELHLAGCALCTPPEDPAALASAILELYADPARRQRLGASGRRYVAAHYTPEIVARQYDDLLRRVARARRAKAKPVAEAANPRTELTEN